jgi:transposase-like protein
VAAPKKYPDELRERAVRLYQETHPRPVIRRLAEQLGVHHEALRNWIRQDEANRGECTDRPTTTETEELRRLRKENAELRRANEILKAASAFFAQEMDPTRREVLNAVAHLRDRFGVGPVLRVLGIASSTFYGWLAQQRNPSARRRSDDQILADIAAIHDRSGGTYGSPRGHATLCRRGVHVSRKRVERLMREAGLQGAFLRKKWRTSSTRQNPAATPAPDLVNRDFTAPRRTGSGSPTQPGSRAGRACSGWPRIVHHSTHPQIRGADRVAPAFRLAQRPVVVPVPPFRPPVAFWNCRAAGVLQVVPQGLRTEMASLTAASGRSSRSRARCHRALPPPPRRCWWAGEHGPVGLRSTATGRASGTSSRRGSLRSARRALVLQGSRGAGRPCCPARARPS